MESLVGRCETSLLFQKESTGYFLLSVKSRLWRGWSSFKPIACLCKRASYWIKDCAGAVWWEPLSISSCAANYLVWGCLHFLGYKWFYLHCWQCWIQCPSFWYSICWRNCIDLQSLSSVIPLTSQGLLG